MLSLENWERAEEVLNAMYDQEGLEITLISILIKSLPKEDQRLPFALLNAMEMCRNRATKAAREIMLSDQNAAA